jgi:hypothetical protein
MVIGCVIRFEDGRMYKVKSDWYYKVHKAKTNIQWNSLSESNVWLMSLNQEIDDVLPVLNDEESRQKLTNFDKKLWKAIENKSNYLKSLGFKMNLIKNSRPMEIRIQERICTKSKRKPFRP